MTLSLPRHEDLNAFVILFSPESVSTFEKKLLSKKPLSPYIDDASHYLNVLAKIVHFAKGGEDSAKIATAYLCAAVGDVLFDMGLYDIKNTDVNTTQQVLLYCSQHYTDSNLCLDTVASNLYLSKSYVSKIFSNKLFLSFKTYINMLRINDAKVQ